MAKARLWPITICRSDGLYSEPSNLERLKQPDGSIEYFEKCPDDDPSNLLWRRKLGGMLGEAMGGPEHRGKKFILAEFPKNYVLWLHRKQINPQTIRSDAYLFGHPTGKKYRSPVEFSSHLLWLATDHEGNSFENCPCKFCHPDGKTPGLPTKAEASGSLGTNKPDGTAGSRGEARASTPTTLTGRGATQANFRTPQNASNATMASKSIPKPPEQEFDAQATNPFIYRPGELVWFSKGQAWGLAIITSRDHTQGYPRYLAQPLSHPVNHPAAVYRNGSQLKPWLAWSLPSTTIKQLNALTYDRVPWEQLVGNNHHGGDVEVDASILAAKAINESYSLFEPLSADAVQQVTTYRGMFLGGEKVWLDEPVRMASQNDDEPRVMILKRIVERKVGSNYEVTLVGDVYKLFKGTTPEQYEDRSKWPQNTNLPPRLFADVTYRNEVAANAGKKIFRQWNIVSQGTQKTIADVKGRWYESRVLLPVLRQPDAYEKDIQSGEVPDVGMFMNSRPQFVSGTGVRKSSRIEALGRAVPVGLQIIDAVPS